MPSFLPPVSLLGLLLLACGCADPSATLPEPDGDAPVEDVIAHETASSDAALRARAARRDASSAVQDSGATSVNPSLADAALGRDAALGHDAGAARDGGQGRDAAAPGDAASMNGPAADAGLDIDSLQQHCVDTINGYRATLSLPPYTRLAAKESCVDGEAAADGASGTAHGSFGTCKESAQDECPGWSSKDMRGQTDKCLAQMWAEGPGDFNMGHGHYINMSSTKYKSVACGFHDLGNGKFWATQDFF